MKIRYLILVTIMLFPLSSHGEDRVLYAEIGVGLKPLGIGGIGFINAFGETEIGIGGGDISDLMTSIKSKSSSYSFIRHKIYFWAFFLTIGWADLRTPEGFGHYYPSGCSTMDCEKPANYAEVRQYGFEAGCGLTFTRDKRFSFSMDFVSIFREIGHSSRTYRTGPENSKDVHYNEESAREWLSDYDYNEFILPRILVGKLRVNI